MKFVSCARLMFVAVVLAIFSAGAQASPFGDAVAGEGKASLCGDCHGFDGNSEDPSFPRLAGQYAGYIFKQVTDFQKGRRANHADMTGKVPTISSEQDIKDIGAYFAAQKIKGSLANQNKDVVAVGEKLFREGNAKTGVYGCVNCHGEKGKGKSEVVTTFPVIGGQHRDYLVKQLKAFRDGSRGNDPAGMMVGVVKKITDEEIEAVAEYLSVQL